MGVRNDGPGTYLTTIVQSDVKLNSLTRKALAAIYPYQFYDWGVNFRKFVMDKQINLN